MPVIHHPSFFFLFLNTLRAYQPSRRCRCRSASRDPSPPAGKKKKKSSHFASEAFGQRVSTDAHGGFFLPVYRLGDGSSCKVPPSPNVHDSGKKWRFLCISQNPGYPNAICWQRRGSMVVILVDACAHYIDASRNIRKGAFVQAHRKLICSTFS